MYDDDYTPQVTGHETEHGFAFTVEVRPPNPDDITDALARRMVSDYTMGQAMRSAVEERFSQLVREAVDDMAKAAISEAMQAPRQRTDEYGNPVGDPVSFQQMIAAQVAAWQEETVDYQGNPKRRDAYSRDVSTRFEHLVRQVGAAEFAKLAKEEVAKVRVSAKALLENTIKDTVAKSLSDLVK